MTSNVPLWSQVQLGKVLKYIEPPVELNDETEYTTITVKRRHGGLEAREKILGSRIVTKKQYKLMPGAFIISRVQCWHQAYAIVPDILEANTIASANYDQFVVSPEVDKRFFWWLSYSPMFTEIVRSCAFGVVIEKMVFNREAWLNKTISLPPLTEQQRIVERIKEFVAKIEEARRLQQEAKSETEALVLSFLRKHLTSNSIMSSLREVLLEKPRNGWSARCDNAESGIPILSLSAVTGFVYRETEFKRTSEPTSNSAHYWLQEGDLLITRSNTPSLVGHAAIYNGSPSPCIYPDLMMRLKINEHLADKRFVHYWLRSAHVREYIRNASKGTSPTMGKISQEIVMNIPFPSHLSLQEQQQTVALIENLDKKVNTLRMLQSSTSAELDAMLPSILDKAFKGEL